MNTFKSTGISKSHAEQIKKCLNVNNQFKQRIKDSCGQIPDHVVEFAREEVKSKMIRFNIANSRALICIVSRVTILKFGLDKSLTSSLIDRLMTIYKKS